jgi:hypothetical protein
MGGWISRIHASIPTGFIWCSRCKVTVADNAGFFLPHYQCIECNKVKPEESYRESFRQFMRPEPVGFNLCQRCYAETEKHPHQMTLVDKLSDINPI